MISMTGPKVKYQVQGQLGEVVVNPYRVAPLTAIIRNGGYTVKDATVRIVPKKNGQEIKYHVSDIELLTHSGIPVFGLYPDYVNTVEVSYMRVTNGDKPKKEKISESYKIYGACLRAEQRDDRSEVRALPHLGGEGR